MGKLTYRRRFLLQEVITIQKNLLIGNFDTSFSIVYIDRKRHSLKEIYNTNEF